MGGDSQDDHCQKTRFDSFGIVDQARPGAGPEHHQADYARLGHGGSGGTVKRRWPTDARQTVAACCRRRRMAFLVDDVAARDSRAGGQRGRLGGCSGGDRGTPGGASGGRSAASWGAGGRPRASLARPLAGPAPARRDPFRCLALCGRSAPSRPEISGSQVTQRTASPRLLTSSPSSVHHLVSIIGRPGCRPAALL